MSILLREPIPVPSASYLIRPVLHPQHRCRHWIYRRYHHWLLPGYLPWLLRWTHSHRPLHLPHLPPSLISLHHLHRHLSHPLFHRRHHHLSHHHLDLRPSIHPHPQVHHFLLLCSLLGLFPSGPSHHWSLLLRPILVRLHNQLHYLILSPLHSRLNLPPPCVLRPFRTCFPHCSSHNLHHLHLWHLPTTLHPRRHHHPQSHHRLQHLSPLLHRPFFLSQDSILLPTIYTWSLAPYHPAFAWKPSARIFLHRYLHLMPSDTVSNVNNVSTLYASHLHLHNLPIRHPFHPTPLGPLRLSRILHPPLIPSHHLICHQPYIHLAPYATSHTSITPDLASSGFPPVPGYYHR
jgi:hypothetical protein